MAPRIELSYDGPIATITNNNPDAHNAFDDEMDLQLFAALRELRDRKDVRAVIWRGEGPSWSSGRDVASIGTNKTELTHHELMSRGHAGIQQIWDLEAPVIVAIQGWALGGSFQRALLCDIRICSTDAKFMLPEVGHGVIPDTGGVARLFQICGHGVVSRVVAPERLDDEVREMAEKIAAAPTATVKMARRIISHLSQP